MVTYEKKESIALITINRPDAMNALDLETSAKLVDVWKDFRDNRSLLVAIITGAGEKAFCAGADLKKIDEFYSLTPIQRREKANFEPGLGGITRNLQIYKPIIAAINGVCVAGGLEIALSCDIRIASENASFALSEVKWGIIPGAGGTQRLPRIVPLGRAMEMILTAEKIDAQTAFEIGLVNRVVAKSDLMEIAMEIGKRICANPPDAVRTAKEAILRGLELPLSQGLILEQLLAEPLRQASNAAKKFAERK